MFYKEWISMASNQEEKKVGIIGMGASGLMAAIAAAKTGAKVWIFDGNEKAGKKIYITGKGRCNVTNGGDLKKFLFKTVRNPKFLFSAFAQFSNQDLIHFFESRGLALKKERGNRFFPVSDKSSDIIKVLENSMREEGVQINFHKKVAQVDFKEKTEDFILTFEDGSKKEFDRLILCTGGLSYPSTGSTGDGYIFAKNFGHKIETCYPSLVPVKLEDTWLKSVEGLSLKNVTLHAKIKQKDYSYFGEMIFTSSGISGPIVLELSTILGGIDKNQVILSIDWKPALDQEALHNRLLREREKGPNRLLVTIFETMLPKSMVPIFGDLLAIDLRRPMNGWTREEQDAFIQLLKNFPLTYAGLESFKQAVVTRGGVSTKEVDPSTMESKKQKGLFLAGELLDLDAHTGGYNLQIAFSTGFVAGKHAGEG